MGEETKIKLENEMRQKKEKEENVKLENKKNNKNELLKEKQNVLEEKPKQQEKKVLPIKGNMDLNEISTQHLKSEEEQLEEDRLLDEEEDRQILELERKLEQKNKEQHILEKTQG